MKPTVTAQQTAFFTQNGYIEFEGLVKEDVIGLARGALARQKPPQGRDLWRQEPKLQSIFLKKLSWVAFALTGKQKLRMGCDQWFPFQNKPEKAGPIKDLLSVQGLALGLLWASDPAEHAPSNLGLLPFPSQPGNILFFRPDLLLDWPNLPPTDLYLALYALDTAVYVQNLKDPSTNALKQCGYGFGDPLRNEFHPLIVR